MAHRNRTKFTIALTALLGLIGFQNCSKPFTAIQLVEAPLLLDASPPTDSLPPGSDSQPPLNPPTGPQIGELQGYTWTPERDAQGLVTEVSWQSLESLTWYEVSSSTPTTELTAKLKLNGFDPAKKAYAYGSLNPGAVTGSFNAWVGGVLAVPHDRFYVPWGGGHADSSINAIFSFDLRSLTWMVDQMPSDPNRPGYEWDAAYITGPNYGSYTSSIDGSFLTDMLPDQRPTSRHTYNSITYDSKRDIIMQHRHRRWAFSLSQQTLSNRILPWHQNLSDAQAAGVHAHYDPLTDATFFSSTKSYDYFSLYKINESDGSWAKVASVPGGFVGGHMWGVKDREIVFAGLAGDYHFAVYDMDQNKITQSGQIQGWIPQNYNHEMQPFLWVPPAKKFLFRSKITQEFYWIDPLTWTQTPVTFKGAPPGYGVFPGSKVFWYPKRNAVVYIGEGQSNVFVLKL